jgi:predicted nucleic acid-binding protein
MEPVLLDTGVIYALLNKRESKHEECLRVFRELYRPIVTCEAVIVESCFLLSKYPQGIEVLLTNVRSGLFRIPLRIAKSSFEVLELLRKYRDTPASFADACLIAMANELGTGDILTLDGDFKHYRWRRNRAFNLLIALD